MKNIVKKIRKLSSKQALKFLLNREGLSILEVTIAIGIIATGILGVVSLNIQNIKVQSLNKNYLAASMLAQEGLELVRNLRDENWANFGVPWYQGITDGNVGQNAATDIYTLYMDAATKNIIKDTSVNAFSDSNSTLNLVGGYYEHGLAGDPTRFKRIVFLTDFDINADSKIDYINVVSSVVWREGNSTRNYDAETRLYDWR